MLCAVFCAFTSGDDKLSIRDSTGNQGSYHLIEKTILIHMEPRENQATWLV